MRISENFIGNFEIDISFTIDAKDGYLSVRHCLLPAKLNVVEYINPSETSRATLGFFNAKNYVDIPRRSMTALGVTGPWRLLFAGRSVL